MSITAVENWEGSTRRLCWQGPPPSCLPEPASVRGGSQWAMQTFLQGFAIHKPGGMLPTVKTQGLSGSPSLHDKLPRKRSSQRDLKGEGGFIGKEGNTSLPKP